MFLFAWDLQRNGSCRLFLLIIVKLYRDYQQYNIQSDTSTLQDKQPLIFPNFRLAVSLLTERIIQIFNHDRYNLISNMIKRDVLHRTEIKTVYSSERQERMKVYFELSEKYNECIEPCKLQPNEEREKCMEECEKIFDQYADILKDRYQNNKERLQMEVKDLPTFNARRRPDRQGWFYDIFGVSFKQWLGYDTAPKINTEQRRV